MQQCLRCKSVRVAQGRIVNYDSNGAAAFRPAGIRSFTLTLSQGPQLAKEGYACLDCGLAWSSLVPEELAKFIRRHCEKTSET
jgi:hypothetical protein